MVRRASSRLISCVSIVMKGLLWNACPVLDADVVQRNIENGVKSCSTLFPPKLDADARKVSHILRLIFAASLRLPNPRTGSAVWPPVPASAHSPQKGSS